MHQPDCLHHRHSCVTNSRPFVSKSASSFAACCSLSKVMWTRCSPDKPRMPSSSHREIERSCGFKSHFSNTGQFQYAGACDDARGFPSFQGDMPTGDNDGVDWLFGKLVQICQTIPNLQRNQPFEMGFNVLLFPRLLFLLLFLVFRLEKERIRRGRSQPGQFIWIRTIASEVGLKVGRVLSVLIHRLEGQQIRPDHPGPACVRAPPVVVEGNGNASELALAPG